MADEVTKEDLLAIEEEKNVAIWRLKKLVDRLNNTRGNGTSMISLVCPGTEQIPSMTRMLTEEYSTASNIKSRVNRLSVLTAITQTQTRLKLYNRVPKNGLCVYSGTVMTDEGKEKKMSMSFEPFRPINTFLYLCDNKFHTEALEELLNSDEKFGFIIMDGSGTLFAEICGNNRQILQKITVSLPKKHNKGGQSSARFGRIRLEKRNHYAKKVAEIANTLYIDLTTNKPNVKGLVLAGSAGFKTVLSQHEAFDTRLQNIVLQTLDISYGQEEGLKQAIKLAQGCLTDVKFVQEQKLLNTYMDEIRQDTGCYCFGVKDTLSCLEMGAVQLLIVYEDLSSLRVVTKNPQGLEDIHIVEPSTLHTVPKKDKDTDQDLEIVSNELLVEYLALNYKNFGTTIEFVSNKSAEGSQFCSGFGGIGGILRYPIDMAALDPMDSSEMDDLDDFI